MLLKIPLLDTACGSTLGKLAASHSQAFQQASREHKGAHKGTVIVERRLLLSDRSCQTRQIDKLKAGGGTAQAKALQSAVPRE